MRRILLKILTIISLIIISIPILWVIWMLLYAALTYGAAILFFKLLPFIIAP